MTDETFELTDVVNAEWIVSAGAMDLLCSISGESGNSDVNGGPLDS